MTFKQQAAARPPVPVQQERLGETSTLVAEPRGVVLHGLPRSVKSEEAYLRSAMEQAATDIAAGW